MFIENHIFRNVDFTWRGDTFITFMRGRIPKKSTLLWSEVKFVSIVRMEKRKISTPKGSKKHVIRLFLK